MENQIANQKHQLSEQNRNDIKALTGARGVMSVKNTDGTFDLMVDIKGGTITIPANLPSPILSMTAIRYIAHTLNNMSEEDLKKFNN